MYSKSYSVVRQWLPLAFVSTLLAGFMYATVQQNYRQNANDPQIQMAEDAARKLAAGTPAADVVVAEHVDLEKSLAPWLTVVEGNGQVLASSAKPLSGTVAPVPPAGTLTYAKTHSQNRLTWQPQSNVRMAIVIRSVNSGSEYVIAGRSLREVEVREGQLTEFVMAAWLAAVAGSLVLILILAWFKPPMSQVRPATP